MTIDLYQGEREGRHFLAVCTLAVPPKDWDGTLPTVTIYELKEDGTYALNMEFYYEDEDYPGMARDEKNRAAIAPYFTVTHCVVGQ